MSTIEFYSNGFARVAGHYVRGVNIPGVFEPNASRPSCTCSKGHQEKWCEHKTAVRDMKLAQELYDAREHGRQTYETAIQD
jgi:hypothetical protein